MQPDNNQKHIVRRLEDLPRGTRAIMDDVRAQQIDLPPAQKEKRVTVVKPIIEEEIVEVPHVQYVERIQEVVTEKLQKKVVAVPRMEITERIIEIPKPVKEERIVEVPQIQIVDHFVEVPKYITQTKVVDKPRILLQERVIPIPKRVVEEKVVEIPEADYERILADGEFGLAHDKRQREGPGVLGDQPDIDTRPYPPGGYSPDGIPLDIKGYPAANPNQYAHFGSPRPDFYKFHGPADPLNEFSQDSSGNTKFSRAVDEVVEIPHVQHIYRNVMKPVYRHVPKPVEVPLTHYKPNPIEHPVDRNVPIPVELEVVQEFLCPRIIPKYVEVTVPIPVTRTIERPVPTDAMFNSVIMDAYMQAYAGSAPKVNQCTQLCGGQAAQPQATDTAKKLNSTQLKAVGLQSSPSFSDVKSFKSRNLANFKGVNMSQSNDFLTTERTLFGKQQ